MHRLIPALCLGVVLSGCGFGPATRDLADVSRPETLILRKQPGQGQIQALRISGEGSIRGTARIELILNGKPSEVEALSGPVRFSWGSDWYADQAEVRYTPMAVTGGRLRLRYRFSD
jgi:hypothetical protein